MRIMQFLSGTGINGAVLQCVALTRALAARGHELHLVCRAGAWIGTQFNDSGVRVVHDAMGRWPLADARRMADYADHHAIDVLHTHQSRAHTFGIIVRWFSGVPCVATAHARHMQPHWCFNDFVIANSQATFEFQQRWNLVPRTRMQVVHYLLNSAQYDQVAVNNRLRSEWGLTDEHRVAAVIGDLIPRKGQLHAVRAWAEVARELPQARLVFVGTEKDARYVERVRAEVERLNLAERVIFAGFHANIPAVMQAIDLCVSSAVEEALGLTIPEAMLARRAVVATNVGGVPENVWHNETGLLVPPNAPAALADGIRRLLSNDEVRRQFAETGWQRVREKYNGEQQLQQVEAIYSRLCNAPAPTTLEIHAPQSNFETVSAFQRTG